MTDDGRGRAALFPFARPPWTRAVFWGLVALAVVPVAVVGDAGIRVPALLVAVLATAQCALGVFVWRRRTDRPPGA